MITYYVLVISALGTSAEKITGHYFNYWNSVKNDHDGEDVRNVKNSVKSEMMFTLK